MLKLLFNAQLFIQFLFRKTVIIQTKQKMKIILIFLITINAVLSSQFTSVYGVQLANINIQLPNLAYKYGNDTFLLFNGAVAQPTSFIRQVNLEDRILNADFNNDGHPDAAVMLNIVHYQLGLFYRVVFVVLMDYATGAYITNGIAIGTSTYKIDVFSMDMENKKIIIEYVPGIRKGAPQPTPALMTLSLQDRQLVVDTSRNIQQTCYPF